MDYCHYVGESLQPEVTELKTSRNGRDLCLLTQQNEPNHAAAHDKITAAILHFRRCQENINMAMTCFVTFSQS